MKPVRIQRKRTKGYDMQAESMAINGLQCVSVCRPGKWGNPFPAGKQALDVPRMYRFRVARNATHAVYLFRRLIDDFGLPMQCDIEELRGKNLSCWCKIGDPCHGDVLLQLANQ